MTPEPTIARHIRGWLLAILATLAVLGGCGASRPFAPAGFAAFTGDQPFRAVSPDGVVYRVRREENPGGAPLAFWREALVSRMKAKGYELRDEGELGGADSEPGYRIELAAPLGLHEHGYLIVLYVRGEELVIAEASGASEALANRRAAIVAALESSRL